MSCRPTFTWPPIGESHRDTLKGTTYLFGSLFGSRVPSATQRKRPALLASLVKHTGALLEQFLDNLAACYPLLYG